MLTGISQNKISSTYKASKFQSFKGFAATTQNVTRDKFSKQQPSFTGIKPAQAKKGFTRFVSKLFAVTTKETMEDGTSIISKAFRSGEKYKETRIHPSGLKMKFYLEADGRTPTKIKKYENFRELRETFWLENGVQTSAERYLDSGICEEFKFYGVNNTQCKYLKFSLSGEKQQIVLNLPEPPITGTLPEVKNILPLKHAEILNYKVKSSDLEEFKKEAQRHLNEHEEGQSYIIEGPRYKSLKEFTNELQYKTFAVGNLQKKGYDVSLPKEEDPNAILNIYVFANPEAAAHYNSTFIDNNAKLNEIANRKGQDFAREFDRLVGGTEGRPYDNEAENLLFQTAFAKQYQKSFNYLLDKFYVRTINYKGKNDFIN